MNGKTSDPKVTYWLVFAALGVTLVAMGMWKRMSDADKAKSLFGLR